MVAPWVIPIASLSAIAGVSTVLIWWWFPRTWKKGTEQDQAALDTNLAASRAQQVARAREILDGYKERQAARSAAEANGGKVPEPVSSVTPGAHPSTAATAATTTETLYSPDAANKV